MCKTRIYPWLWCLMPLSTISLDLYVLAYSVIFFQARPITTLDQETTEDLLHEFDDPLVTGREYLTTGNIGYILVLQDFQSFRLLSQPREKSCYPVFTKCREPCVIKLKVMTQCKYNVYLDLNVCVVMVFTATFNH
jgi:hypothetical protein